jgi:hypothetical protein
MLPGTGQAARKSVRQTVAGCLSAPLALVISPMGPLANFWAIVSVPDNVPIVFMLILVGYFTYLSFDEARKNDRLIREGRKDQILRRMQD